MLLHSSFSLEQPITGCHGVLDATLHRKLHGLMFRANACGKLSEGI
jgi:hypothetical protein